MVKRAHFAYQRFSRAALQSSKKHFAASAAALFVGWSSRARAACAVSHALAKAANPHQVVCNIPIACRAVSESTLLRMLLV